jgi:indolepyruvate ferredoxin oxidoreductase beta subunit
MSAPSRFKLLIVGVGGQGVLTAARMLGDAALSQGAEVMVGQLHGMAQRGGSVEASVLFGPGQSSFIADGEADLVLAFEPLEALRALPKMSGRTKVVINLGKVAPFPLSMQGKAYPDLGRIVDSIREVSQDVHQVDGPALLQKAGSLRSLNIFMLGVLADLDALPFDGEILWQAVQRRSAPRFLEGNQTAFELGRGAMG